MKDWTKMNMEELVQLSEQQIEQIKDSICRENKVKLPINPGKPPKLPIKKDLTVFIIDGIYDIYFSSRREAEEIAEIINNASMLTHRFVSNNYNNRYLVEGKPTNYDGSEKVFKVTELDAYSEYCYTKHQESIDNYHEELNLYYIKNSEYNTNLTKYNNAVKPFEDALKAARKNFRKVNELSELFWSKYATSATIAYDAEDFKEIYNLSDEDMDYILKSKSYENL